MEILTIILLLVLIAMDVFLFIKLQSCEPKQMKAQPLPPKPKLTREEKDKQEQIKKSFENLMNYDEKAARRRK
jgi:hypothetical protein